MIFVAFRIESRDALFSRPRKTNRICPTISTQWELQIGMETVLQDSTAKEPRQLVERHGIVCCNSAIKPLSKNPIDVATHLYLRLQPGEYSLFVRTKRISPGWPKPGHYGEGPVVTSDVLELTIMPDHK
jgi:hypothetical protein